MAEHGDDMQDMIPPPIPENADGVPDEGSLGHEKPVGILIGVRHSMSIVFDSKRP